RKIISVVCSTSNFGFSISLNKEPRNIIISDVLIEGQLLRQCFAVSELEYLYIGFNVNYLNHFPGSIAAAFLIGNRQFDKVISSPGESHHRIVAGRSGTRIFIYVKGPF